MSHAPLGTLHVSVAMDTHIGKKRAQNQDAIGHTVPSDPAILAEAGQIFVLADGVGGLSGGDLASQYAVSTIISSYYEQREGSPADRLARAIAEANSVIYAENQGRDERMATTVVAAVIRGHELIIGSVGDSPAYLLRGSSVRKLTLDHTLEELRREEGASLADDDPDARSLVRALGAQQSIKVDIITGKVRDGDHLVLCSDGLTRYVDADEIATTVTRHTPDETVTALIQVANARGGGDNISVIVMHLSEPEEDAAPAGAAATAPVRAAAPETAAPASGRAPSPGESAGDDAGVDLDDFTLPGDSPLHNVLHLLQNNVVMTAAAAFVLLVVFVAIMLLLANFGGDEDDGGPTAAPTTLPALLQTGTFEAESRVATQTAATAQYQQSLFVTATAQAGQTATVEYLIENPPPPAGPQMDEDVWFLVLDGPPIPAYTAPDRASEVAAPLEAGGKFRISDKEEEGWFTPWYLVTHTSGLGGQRWVSGPDLHQRVTLINPDNSEPLPDELQPTDIPPLDFTPPAPTPTASPEAPPSLTPELTAQGTPDYPEELWLPGTIVVTAQDLILRETRDTDGASAGEVGAGVRARVLEGPVPTADHWWWRVEIVDDDREGWIAQPLLRFSELPPE